MTSGVAPNFFSVVVSVSSANVGAQLLISLSSLVVGLLLGPQIFAGYTILFGAAVILSMVATLKLDLSIFDSSVDERLAVTAMVLAVVIIFCLTASVFVCVAVAFGLLSLQYLLPIFLGGSIALQSIVFGYLVASEQYLELNRLRLLHAILLSAAQILMALSFKSSIPVLSAHFLVNIFLMCYFLYRFGALAALSNLSLNALPPFLISNGRYIKFSMPAEFVGSVAGLLPVMIIQSLFGSTSAGLYAMAVRIAGVPAGFLGKAVGEVFRGRLSNCESGTDRLMLFEKSGAFLVKLSICIGVVILGVHVVGERALFIPAEWTGLPTVLLITWLLYGAKLVSSPLSFTLFFFRKNHVDLLWQLGMLIALSIPLLLPLAFRSALILQCLTGGLLYVAMYAYCRSLFRGHI